MNTLSGYSKSTLTDNFVLTAAGGHLAVGNADKNIPINNGTVCTNLNADKVDGKNATDFLLYYEKNYGANISNVKDIDTTLTSGLARIHISNVEYSSVLTGYDYNSRYWQLRFVPGAAKGLYYRNTTSGTEWQLLAFVSDIPTVTNYYWANVKIKSSEDKTTVPTFGGMNVTGESNLRKTAVVGTSTGETSINANLDALVVASATTRATASGTYYPGIALTHMWNFDSAKTYLKSPQAWIGTRLFSTEGSERSALVFATKGTTGTLDRPTERMCITHDGNVGIGIKSPTALLHVNGVIKAVGTANVYESGTTTRTTINTTSGIGRIYAYDETSALFKKLYVGTNGASAIVADTNNYIGIGVDSPENKLDVNGVLQIYVRGARNNAFDNLLLLKLQNSSEPSGDSWDESYPSFGIGFRRYWTSGTSPYGETTCAGIYATVSSSWRGGLVFRTKNNTTNGGTHDVTALRLSPSGQLYIIKPINTSLTTSTHLAGNQGTAIINSTATAGSYTMLAKMNSNNGYFTHGTYQDGYKLYYTAKSTVDAGTNTITKTATLLNEDGDSVLSGYANAAGFKRSGSDNNYVLLGGGSHKAISDFLPSGNYAGSDTSGGKAYYSYKLYYASTATLSTKAAIDGFLEAYTFKALLWNGSNAEDNLSTSYPGAGNGTILSGGYSSATYGFQLAIDDDPNWFMALRQRGNGTWSAWKRIPMGDGTGASGTWSINITGSAGSAGNADTLDSQHGDWYRKNVLGFTNTGLSASNAYDCNTLKDGIIYNYGAASYWKNGPSGMSYGQVLNLRRGDSYSLMGLLAWDVNHASTTDTTRYLWWRASDDGTLTEAKWHQIAFTDTKVQNASNADVATKLARAEYLESDDAINGFLEPNRFKFGQFKTTAANQLNMGSNDGMILSIPWGSTDYGFQMAFDDSTNCVIKARGKASSWGTWRTLYHTGNLTKVSQLTNDSGYITSRGYIGTTAVLASSASLDLTGISWINGGIRLNKANDDCGRIQGLGHGLEFGGPGYAHMNYYFRPHYGTSGSTLTNVYIQNASADSAPTFTTTHSFSNSGNASHSGTVTSTGFIKSGSSNSYVLLGGGGHKTESSLSVSYAASAGNADTLDNYHASGFVKFYLSPLEANAPAASAKTWFTNTMPSSSGAIVYNVPGSEKTIIVGKSSGAFGHMLQLNYDDTYLRILRYFNGSWKSTDWEKISAGYADSAANADKLDSLDSTAFMRASSDGSYYGIQHPGGDTTNWTRTTTNGIIPVKSGGASSLGTSSWPFNTVYATNFYGYLNGNISGNAAYATSAGSATTATRLLTNNTSQAADACYTEDPGLRFWRFNGTGNTVGGADGWILSWSWNSGSVGGQIYLDDNPSKIMAIRGYNTDKTFTTWSYFIHSGNIGSQSVNYANSAGSVAWGNITGKPTEFNPASHTHSYLPLAGGTMTGTIITPADDTKGIIPATNNYGLIGSSDKKFFRMYATTFYGTLSGNCTGSAGSVAWANVTGKPDIPTVSSRSLTVNGTAYTFYSNTTTAAASFYAPTSVGSSYQILVSGGSTSYPTPYWENRLTYDYPGVIWIGYIYRSARSYTTWYVSKSAGSATVSMYISSPSSSNNYQVALQSSTHTILGGMCSIQAQFNAGKDGGQSTEGPLYAYSTVDVGKIEEAGPDVLVSTVYGGRFYIKAMRASDANNSSYYFDGLAFTGAGKDTNSLPLAKINIILFGY